MAFMEQPPRDLTFTDRHTKYLKEGEHFLSKRMVIKIGTSTITTPDGHLDLVFMRDIARQCVELSREGIEVVIVSSGAVAAGKNKDFPTKSIVDNQIEAVFGQPRLMESWIQAFVKHGIEDVGQFLLTDADLKKRKRKNNVREVIMGSLQRGIVVVNCNDGVTDEEMRAVGRSADNDKLAVDIVKLIRADTLIFLGDKDGVIDETGEALPYFDRVKDIQNLATDSGSGTGGALSKWKEAKSAAIEDVRTFIANGRTKDVILKIANGENVGTEAIKGFRLY